MFWGGERLGKELDALISDYDPEQIDRAAYRLRIGPEVYVSPTGEPHDPRNKPKTQLSDEQGFTIPAGQFGFILTEERVRVPTEAIAFISIRASYKFQGLVNVSGFHVDPGYDGRLVFAVFNAGPGSVHLSRGEPCFLIWYADLDQPANVPPKPGYNGIPSEIIGPIADGLQSYSGLFAKIKETEDKLTDRIHAVEREHAVLKWAGGLAIGVLLTLALRECTLSRASGESPRAAVTAPASPSPASPAP